MSESAPPESAAARALRLLPGLAAAAAVVVAAEAVAGPAGRALVALRGLDPATVRSPVPSVPVAIVIGLLLGNLLPLPASLKPGLAWCARTGLRLGIVLVGLRLSLPEVAAKGLGGLPVMAAALGTALVAAPWLAARLGVSSRLGLLAAASTGICGVTAALAAAPAVEAEDREVSYTVANVTLYGLLGMLAYPWLAHATLGGAPAAAGAFLGSAIHDTSQVLGAALAYDGAYGSRAAFEAATVTKLARNACLAGVIPLLGWMHARSGGAAGRGKGAGIPGFVWGFLAAAALRSILDASGGAAAWQPLFRAADAASVHGLLPAAMASVGLTARFADLRALGWRPLALGAGAALAAGAAAFTVAASLAAAGWMR
jgi:uncharacterized integral membrane protein (TIGR00698 family)